MNTLSARLAECKSFLPAGEAVVAQYIQEETDKASRMSIVELSAACHISSATVSRLCRRLGLSGYRELLRLMAAENSEPHTAAAFQPLDTPIHMAQQIAQAHLSAIENTLALVDETTLQHAVEVLSKAARVDFYGIGTSGTVAQDASFKFARIGKISQMSSDSHQQLLYINSLRPGNVAVFISYSGETKEMVQSCRLARSRGATTISITRCGRNTLSRLADIRLYSVDVGLAIDIGPVSSRISQLTVTDFLYSAVLSQNWQSMEKYLNSSHHLVQNRKIHADADGQP